MIDFLKKARSTTVLGLAFDGTRIEGAVLRRTNGSVRVQQTFSAVLALDVLNAEPELVGREIRNHLNAAGIRERRCAVCVPLNWALTLQAKLPDLPEPDLASFLQIEAERGFPTAHEALSTATSRLRSASGELFATLLAIPRNHLLRLETALNAAQLRPESFSLGLPVLQEANAASSETTLALMVTMNSLALQLTCGGGIAALRTLDGAIETEGVQKNIDVEFLAREIRITLGQLPESIRQSVRSLRIIGRGERRRKVERELAPRLKALGLDIELVERSVPAKVEGAVPPEFSASPAIAIGTSHLMGGVALEFLPPKISPWQQMASRFSSPKLAWAGATAGVVAAVILAAFLVQEVCLLVVSHKWHAMEAKAKELDLCQQNIKKYRPWFDDSVRSLAILRRVAESFPEDGQVSARTFELREPSSVTCSGVARDNQAFLQMVEKLRAAQEISNVKIEQVRGQSPMQFTFSFQWEGGANAN